MTVYQAIIKRCSWSIRHVITKKQDSKCYFCEKRLPLQLHRIKPVEYGGETTEENCLCTCGKCHVVFHKRFDEFFALMAGLNCNFDYKTFTANIKKNGKMP